MKLPPLYSDAQLTAQRKVHTALKFSHKPLNNRDLADKANLTAYATRTALIHLADLGYATSDGKAQPKWLAVDPETATEPTRKPAKTGNTPMQNRTRAQMVLRIAPPEFATTADVIARTLKMSIDAARKALAELKAEGLAYTTGTRVRNYHITERGKTTATGFIPTGNAASAKSQSKKQQLADVIVEILKRAGRAMKGSEIAKAVKKNRSAVTPALLHLVDTQKIIKIGDRNAEWSLT